MLWNDKYVFIFLLNVFIKRISSKMTGYKYYILAKVPGVARGIYKIELWRKKKQGALLYR